jgi:hypothetical protein
MAELDDVYGQNYQNESKQSKNNYVLNNITNNLAHRQFSFRLFDSNDLWEPTHNLSVQAIESIINKVKNINQQLYLYHLNKQSNTVNMLPELVIDTPVEYFMIIDAEYHRAYFVYITPYEVNAY